MAAVCAYFFQALDVHHDLAPEVSFYLKILFDDVANPVYFFRRQFDRLFVGINLGLADYLQSKRRTDAKNIPKRDADLFIIRNVCSDDAHGC